MVAQAVVAVGVGTRRLVDLVRELAGAEIAAIIVVNDGSSDDTAAQARALDAAPDLVQRQTMQAEGHATLAEVPAEQINEVSQLVHLYQRAIYAATGAEICERYRSYDSTNSGNQNADEISPSIDELRRDQRWAVRDFLGINRTTVELI